MLTLIALTTALQLAAQNDAPISLRYELSAKEVQQGDTFQLDVVLRVNSQQQIEELSLPEMPRGLTVLQERRGMSTQISNGRVNTEQRYVYMLRADDAGAHRIGEATARLGRSVARAAPIMIRVTPGEVDADDGDGDAASAADAGKPPGARFGKELPASFLEVSVDKEELWVGEQLTVTTEVYTQQPLSQWPRLAPMKPPGFLCVPLLGDERPSPKQRSLHGRMYNVYLVNKDALFPTSPGDKALPAQSVDLVPAGSFFSRGREVNVKSPKLGIEVKALPESDSSGGDKPARFVAGNVGTFQLQAGVRPLTATLGQPFTLTIWATGNGNLDQVTLPAWDGSDAVRVFPPTTKIERRPTDAVESVVGGRVLAEMLVQPQREGELRIPSFTFAFFDPQAGAYRESTTAPIIVPVKPPRNASSSSAGASPFPTGGRQTIARGARPLRTKLNPKSPAGDAPVYVAGAVFLAGALAYAAGTLRRRRRASAAGQRAQRAAQLRATLDDATKRGDLALLERVVLDALEERYGAGVKACSTSELGALLTSRGAGAGAVDVAVQFIRDVEAARYGGAVERQRLIAAGRALVDEASAAGARADA